MHHSRERRETPIQCRRCRRWTCEFDMVCEDCAIARATPPDTSTYFVFDLDTDRVEVPEFRVNPDELRAELLTALQ